VRGPLGRSPLVALHLNLCDDLNLPMNKPSFSLCVYCGSRPGSHPEFSDIARAVGQWIGRHGGQLVYGGGRNGLMGTVAQATLDAGGRVVGVIPKALVEKEWANHNCTDLHVVDTMHERKRLMAEHAHAFLALPGGIGTFEEFFEVWTWRQLGYHDKPVGLLNVSGYYDGLLQFLGGTVDKQFMSSWQMDMIRVGSDAQTLLPDLIQAAGLSPESRLDAI
jgi:uncharacterized protein (TIGR00730 family)